jgi:hypothetical protein
MSKWGLLARTWSWALTGPMTSRGLASGALVNVRTSARASRSVLSAAPALRESSCPPMEGVGSAGS